MTEEEKTRIQGVVNESRKEMARVFHDMSAKLAELSTKADVISKGLLESDPRVQDEIGEWDKMVRDFNTLQTELKAVALDALRNAMASALEKLKEKLHISNNDDVVDVPDDKTKWN